VYALEQALNNDGKDLLSNEEYQSIINKLDILKSRLSGDNSDLIEDGIKEVEKQSEFYVERRMNSSIKSLIAGKGIDDIL
jgi:molecular chaperone HscA